MKLLDLIVWNVQSALRGYKKSSLHFGISLVRGSKKKSAASEWKLIFHNGIKMLFQARSHAKRRGWENSFLLLSNLDYEKCKLSCGRWKQKNGQHFALCLCAPYRPSFGFVIFVICGSRSISGLGKVSLITWLNSLSGDKVCATDKF